MNHLDNSLLDIIPISYPGYSNGVLYEETAGFIPPGGGYNVSETTCEPIMTTDVQKETSSFAMSTAFNLYIDLGDGGSDIILVSRDAVHFFVRRSCLLNAPSSQPAYPPDPYLGQTTRQVVPLTEDAETLNVILHVIYGVSFRMYSPPLEILLQAIHTLEKYGIALDIRVLPGTPLFDDIVLKMPYQPLEGTPLDLSLSPSRLFPRSEAPRRVPPGVFDTRVPRVLAIIYT